MAFQSSAKNSEKLDYVKSTDNYFQQNPDKWKELDCKSTVDWAAAVERGTRLSLIHLCRLPKSLSTVERKKLRIEKKIKDWTRVS